MVAACAACFAACGGPPLRPSSDTPPPAGIITGTVTVTGTPARGDLFVLLFPQLPASDGSCPAAGTTLVEPANLLRIDSSEVFRDPGGATFSVDFVIPQVPVGCYSIGALVDADADFYPLFGVTAGATKGDGLGGAFEEPIPDPPALPTLRVIEVVAAEGIVPAIEGVQVLVGATVPTERPSFTIDSLPPGGMPSIGLAAPGAAFTITATAIDVPLVNTGDPDVACPMGGPLFPIILGPDLDGDYVPEDLDGDMAPDVYGTRVLMRRLSDGLPEAALPPAPWDEDEDFPLIVPGVIDPTAFIMYHAMVLMTPPDGMTLLAACSLTIQVPPLGVMPGRFADEPPTIMPLAAWEAAAGGDPSLSPVGAYTVLAILAGTNQTWEVPNELMLLAMDPTQAAAFAVTP